MTEKKETNPWEKYQGYTAARIGLKRSGGSIGTSEMLKFRYDHAKARDAVWTNCNFSNIQAELSKWLPTYILRSKARTREEYLLRPDLGRQLDETSILSLTSLVSNEPYDLVFCIVDGLSPFAISSNLVEFMTELKDELNVYKLAPIICVENGRVAVGDQVSEVVKAKMAIVLIGERPGLSSVDSIGAYITFGAKTGTTDERRNCISNIRPAGLSFDRAKVKLIYLIREAFQNQITGVGLKDRMLDSIPGKDQEQIM